LLREKAAMEGYKIHELQLASDHVHLFLGIGPTQSISEAIRQLKCNSARMLFKEYPELKKEILVRTLLVERQILQIDRAGDGRDNTALHRQISARLIRGYPKRELGVLHFFN